LAARLAGIAHIVRMVHGLPETFTGLKNIKMICYVVIDRFLSKLWVQRFVGVSFSIVAFLEDKFVKGRIICIHNGIDLERAKLNVDKRREIRSFLRVGDREIVVGTVGRLSPIKAHDQLLRAVHRLVKDGYKVRILLVGEGPMEQSLRELGKNLGLGDSIIFAGHQENVLDYLGAIDVFVLPSMREGIPMALLEALALERPVVATRVGGIPEVVEDDVSGLLVSPGDFFSLSEGIRVLIEDRSKAISLGKAGRARIEQEFNAELMARRTLQMYQGLSSCHRTPK
jgi:glycosyltransferase involved in cell wall biosynthesis